jgi:RNA polymerase sigma-70 factor (ECF subfamily)
MNGSGEVRRLESGSTDEELVERVLAGDRWAEEAFYRRHVDLVAATALRLLRNRAEAEDVVQETFLLAFENMHQLRDAQAVRGWLARVAVTRVHRRFRWNAVRKLIGLGHAHQEDGLEACAASTLDGEARSELALVERALEALKTQERTAWLLRHAVGYSLEEIATACGCSLAAVKRRLQKADARVEQHVGVEARGSARAPNKESPRGHA